MRRKSAVLVLTLLAFLVGAGAAQAELGLKALEARLGFTDPEGWIDGTFIVSGAADLGYLAPDLGLEINVDFWNKGMGSQAADWTYTNIGFLANLRYMFKTNSSFHPFVFGGPGLHYWNASWDCPGCTGDFTDLSNSGVEFGVDVGAGANWNGGANYVFIQGGLKFPME